MTVPRRLLPVRITVLTTTDRPKSESDRLPGRPAA